MSLYNTIKIHHSDSDENYFIVSELRNRNHAAYSPTDDLLMTTATAKLVQSLTKKKVTKTTLPVKNVSFDEPNAETNAEKTYDILDGKGFYVKFVNDTVLETDCPWILLHRMYPVTEWVDEEEQD